MYFSSYEEALKAAIKQSVGQLGDCNIYIKHIFMHGISMGYAIGFTPDNAEDGYVLMVSSLTQ